MKTYKHKTTYKLYHFIGIAILCFSLIMLTYNMTSAWFMDESVTSNGDNLSIIATIDLDVTTNFNFYNLALAPDTIYKTDQHGADIGTYMKTSDKTSTNLAVYVRVRYTTNRPELSLYFESNEITTEKNNYDAAQHHKKWVLADDGYYYYLDAVRTSNIRFNSGYKTDNTFINSKAGDPVSITLEFEAIQQPYGAYADKGVWADPPKIFKQFAQQNSGYAWEE